MFKKFKVCSGYGTLFKVKSIDQLNLMQLRLKGICNFAI